MFWVCMFCLPKTDGYSQSIVWEKQWGFAQGSEEILKICPTQDGNFFGLGYSSKFRIDTMGSTYYYYVLIKFNQNGDTLFMKRLNYLHAVACFLGHKFGNMYQLVVQTQTAWNARCPVFVDFNANGDILQSSVFSQYTNYYLGDGMRTPDGGLLFPGTNAPPGGNQSAFKFNFLNELEWALSYFPPVAIPGNGNRLEPMNNGHYLLSGIIGKRIYGFEIDSAGNEIGQKEFYQTPSNYVFQYGAVLQGFWKGFFAFGYYSNNGYVGCFSRIDSLGNKIWGGEIPGTIVNSVIVNKESSFIMATNGGDGVNITRLTKDSVVLWKLSLGGLGQPYRFMNGLHFSTPDTGIAYGIYYQSAGNLGNQFWMAKITGVDTAYDPVHPEDTITVSAQEKIFRPKDAPILYPNPTTERIQFTKLKQKTQLAIYSTTGVKLLEKPIQPEESIDVCDLQNGAYLYHLKMGERVFTGKFLKR